MARLKNTITGVVVGVSDEIAERMIGSEWKRAGGRSGSSAAAAAAPESDGLFDPTTGTVGSVTAYLETADDAERERVLDAERAGKARTGIVSWAPPSTTD